MRLFVNLDTLCLVRSAVDARPITRLQFVRGAATELELQFVQGGEAVLIAEGSEIRFMVKADGEFDGDPVVFTDDFTAPEDETGYYTASPSFNTEELNALLFSPDENPENDEPSVTLGGSISWGDGESDPAKTLPFAVIVRNSYDNGAEGTPTQALAIESLTESAKLALVSPRIGKLVEVSDQGDRLEMFKGGDADDNANWVVLKPTINLTVSAALNGCTGVEIDGVPLDEGDGTYAIGWVDPFNIAFDEGDSGISDFLCSGSEIFGPGVYSSGPGFISGGGNEVTLPFPVPPRGSVTLNFELAAP